MPTEAALPRIALQNRVLEQQGLSLPENTHFTYLRRHCGRNWFKALKERLFIGLAA